MTRSLVWIAAAIALVGALFWLVPDGNTVSDPVQDWSAVDPWIIGPVDDDAYDYAGDAARTLEGGRATLSIDPTTNTGTLSVTLPVDAQASLVLADVQTPSATVLHQTISSDVLLWIDIPVHGETGVGDARLPETTAQIAGEGPIVVSVDGTPQSEEWTGFWMIGDALRRDDGAIRNQGLIFSPLLRDRSGFSDPERKELTILLYAMSHPDEVVLQIVFPNPIESETPAS
jgi:hypothetical protein